MERKFRINWADIVHEAKNRRLKQNFTQLRLANIAGVSPPTLSRFENMDKDIQLSSALAILGVLGLVDERRLDFFGGGDIYLPEAVSLPDRMVLFWGVSNRERVKCLISHDALEDHYDGDYRDPLEVFKKNRYSIEHEARRKHIAGKLAKDGSILIQTWDL